MHTYYDISKALLYPNKAYTLILYCTNDKTLDWVNELHKLPNLRQLSIFNAMHLNQLPPSILKLPQLRILQLRKTDLEDLPKGIDALISLQELTITKTRLKKLPNSIGKLSKLTKLELKDTELQSLPDSILQLENLRTLVIKNSSLTSLPNELGKLKALNSLDLDNNQLKIIPDSIRELSNLKSLKIRNNQLECLPDYFGNLHELQWLYLSGNVLNSLPSTFAFLSKLSHLSLKTNSFKEFPIEVCQCVIMDILDLENNQLTNVSEDLKNLSILRILKLKENAFKKFPEVLLDWYSISHFGNRWNYCLGRSYYKGLPIVNLLSKKAFKLLSRKEKINYFHIYLNDKTKISRIDKKILLLALNSKLSMVAKYPRLFDQNFKFGASKRI